MVENSSKGPGSWYNSTDASSNPGHGIRWYEKILAAPSVAGVRALYGRSGERNKFCTACSRSSRGIKKKERKIYVLTWQAAQKREKEKEKKARQIQGECYRWRKKD